MPLLKRAYAMGLLAFLATALPLLMFVERSGVAAPLALFEGDAFYYLDITRNSMGRSGFSFDGHYPTNGFHPLWQYFLSLSARCGWLNFARPFETLVHVFIVDTLFLAFGAGLFVIFSAGKLRQPLLALLIFAPGLLWFMAAPITTRYLSTWSYANGMESAISLFFMALALLLLPEDGESVWRDTLFSISIGLAVLARLDDVFFAIALALVMACRRRVSVNRGVLSFLPATLMVLAYMIYNRVTVGAFLPLSGAAKASLGAIKVNLIWSLKLFIPAATRNKPDWLPQGGDRNWYIEPAIHVFQMLVPMAICAATLLWNRKRAALPWVIEGLCLGVLFKGFYNFLFVAGFEQGHWYYTVSVAVANLLLVWWLDRILTNYFRVSTVPLGAGVLAFAALVSFSYAAYYGVLDSTATPYRYDTILAGKQAGNLLRQQGDACFVEMDDGFLSFALQLPAEAGLGLALDRSATEALHRQQFFSLMEQRHCTLLLSGTYAVPLQTYLTQKMWQSGESLWALQPGEFQQFQLVPQPDPVAGVSAYRIEPRTGIAAP